jgi:hypothetical protein
MMEKGPPITLVSTYPTTGALDQICLPLKAHKHDLEKGQTFEPYHVRLKQQPEYHEDPDLSYHHDTVEIAAYQQWATGVVEETIRSRDFRARGILVFAYNFRVCSEGARTSSYRDKKPPPLNNNEDKKLSLSRGGRERGSGP